MREKCVTSAPKAIFEIHIGLSNRLKLFNPLTYVGLEGKITARSDDLLHERRILFRTYVVAEQQSLIAYVELSIGYDWMRPCFGTAAIGLIEAATFKQSVSRWLD